MATFKHMEEHNAGLFTPIVLLPSSDHTQLQLKSSPAEKMSLTTRRRFWALNYIIMAIHSLLVVLGLAATGLAGNTLYWAAGSSNTNTPYLLDPNVLAISNPPANPNIMQYPRGFTLLGTELLVATGGLAVVVASLTTILIYSWSIQPTKRGLFTPNYSTRFTALTLMSAIAVALSTATLVLSWREYYTTPRIEFSSRTISSAGVYQSNRQTPETWLLKLSTSVDGASNRKPLHDLYIFAAVGRILVAPIFGFQFIAFFALLVLRERLKVGARPPSQMRKLRSSLVEQAYVDHRWDVAKEEAQVEKNNPIDYRPMSPVPRAMDEISQRPCVWSMQAMVDVQPRVIEDPARIDARDRVRTLVSPIVSPLEPTERTALVDGEVEEEEDLDIVEQYRRLVDYNAHPAMRGDDY